MDLICVNGKEREREGSVFDEGMTHGYSIFVYLVFGPRRTSIEGTARPMSMIDWRNPGARLDIQGKVRGDQVELGLD
jgi:hypothetical protein